MNIKTKYRKQKKLIGTASQSYFLASLRRGTRTQSTGYWFLKKLKDCFVPRSDGVLHCFCPMINQLHLK